MKNILGLILLPASMILVGAMMIIYSVVAIISEVFKKKEG